jgi:hypothetical protein
VALFVATDLAARAAFQTFVQEKSIHYSEQVWCAARDYQSLKEAPDLLLLGSSLMMAVVDRTDCGYLKQRIDSRYHHRFQWLEDALSVKLGFKPRTFVFASPGQFASDAYLISSTLLTEGKKPPVLIYGVAPRDFMDNVLKSTVGTEPARCLIRQEHGLQPALSACGSTDEFIDSLLSATSFFYGWRDEVTARLPGAKPVVADGKGHFEVDPAECMATGWKNDLSEYQYRYRPFHPRMFLSQVGYCERLLGFCRRNDIKVVLVRMPISERNKAIMPDGFYDIYRSAVDRLATKYGATVIDADDSFRLTESDYADSVHLNGKGAPTFSQALLSRLLSCRQAVAALVQNNAKAQLALKATGAER